MVTVVLQLAKTMGKPWENHGKTMGKWENHRKTIGKLVV